MWQGHSHNHLFPLQWLGYPRSCITSVSMWSFLRYLRTVYAREAVLLSFLLRDIETFFYIT